MNNELYFRPSPLSALNNRNFDYEFFDKYSNEDYNKIVLPDWLFKSPEDTIINYFSILREAANISQGGCGTIGFAQMSYPIAYNFLTSVYQNRLDYNSYLNSFKDIGHINLIKLNNITDENAPKGTYEYFIEIEAIEPSFNGNTSFAYYYGFIDIKNENGKYKISKIDLRGEDFLCAAYHGWKHNAELYVDTVYGDWCKLLKKRYPTEQNGYIKNIYVVGKDGHDYKFQFFQLTNGTDIEIHQFTKDVNNKWTPIKIDVNKCIERWRFPHPYFPIYFMF
ncbi:hypothetical protein [Clostridium magnum]|uniref:Uncharacterized protein n=1 Tax=Clostridium magnum DSM 2767 TaxID=1121326 RepID=A0A161X8T8_9CLOT|nr:hypothetical protein [Clostridium magnum]KZL90616.1 hypothetical protein CLMAG_43880 [Clostridium magnum DSM 2767]SHI05927.1 hypothetical protein SAMN02745944_02309 [Clostridium magnum DSM 2767]